MPERLAELLSAVSEQLHIVGPARNGNVSDAVVEQVFGPPARRRRIKLDYTVFWAASVHLQTHPSILVDALHGPESTVGQLQVGRMAPCRF